MEWIEVVIPVSVEIIDDVAAILVDSCPQTKWGVQIRGDELVFWAPTQEAEDVVAGVRASLTEIRDVGMDVDPSRVRLERSGPEEEWRDAWKKHFHVTRIGKRIVIQPSWEPYDKKSGDVVLKLDPGMAFGTGTHASTRLVLEELEQLAEQQQFDRIIDVGTGSGILSFAAAQFWPQSKIYAVDNDPIAVSATIENAEINGFGGQIEASEKTLEEFAEPFPLVLANIQAHVILMLKEALIAKAAKNGYLMLSGLLTTQADHVAEEFTARGFVIRVKRADNADPQWTTVVLHRP